ARDIAFVLILSADCKTVELHLPGFRKVKDPFMTIVKKPLRIDWLEMTVSLRARLDPHLALRVRPSLARERMEVKVAWFAFLRSGVDGDRLDPVNRVLQKKSSRVGRKLDRDLVRQHRVRWRGADVQKKRSVRS